MKGLSLKDIAILHKISKYQAKEMVKDYIIKDDKPRSDKKGSNCKIYVSPKYILQDDNHALNHFQLTNKLNEQEDRIDHLENQIENLTDIIKQLGKMMKLNQ